MAVTYILPVTEAEVKYLVGMLYHEELQQSAGLVPASSPQQYKRYSIWRCQDDTSTSASR